MAHAAGLCQLLTEYVGARRRRAGHRSACGPGVHPFRGQRRQRTVSGFDLRGWSTTPFGSPHETCPGRRTTSGWSGCERRPDWAPMRSGLCSHSARETKMLASIRPVGVECGTHPLSRLVGLLSSRRHVGVSAWRGGVGLPTVAIAVGWCWAPSPELWSTLWAGSRSGLWPRSAPPRFSLQPWGPRLISG